MANNPTPLEARKLELKAFTESQVFGDWDKEAIRIAEDLHFLIGEVEDCINYIDANCNVSIKTSVERAVFVTLNQALLKLSSNSKQSEEK